MLTHPQFDPIALSLGPIAIRWYGLMYVVAFVLFVVLGRMHLKRRPDIGISKENLDDFCSTACSAWCWVAAWDLYCFTN